MPKPRFSGGNRSMRRSSSEIVPPVTGSSPAMQLSAVVLPQPEGPSRQMNSPRRMVSVSSCSAAICAPPGCPKWRETRSSRSSLNCSFMGRSCVRRAAVAHCAPVYREPFSLRLLRADLLIPDAERVDHRLGVERLGVRILGQPNVVFGAAEFLDHVLAFLRRHA